MPIVGEAQYAITSASDIVNVTTFPDWAGVSTDPNGGNSNVLVANGDSSGSFLVRIRNGIAEYILHILIFRSGREPGAYKRRNDRSLD